MANDDIPANVTPIAKRPVSRKHRILTRYQSPEKSLINDNGFSTVGNNATSKLPNLLSKSNIFPATPESMQFRRYRSQHKGNITSSLAYKIERQSTNMVNSQTRLPTLHTPSNDNDHKQKSEFQRRQIYALNHLMREYEQEQFRKFCQLNGIGTTSTEEVISNNEDSNKESSM